MPIVPDLHKEQEDEELRWSWATYWIQGKYEMHRKPVAQKSEVWDVTYLEKNSLEYDTNSAMF